MPRSRAQPITKLGIELQRRRGERPLRAILEETGLPDTTLSRIERGTHKPSAETARALARWLGWTTDQVLDAAEEGVVSPPSTES